MAGSNLAVVSAREQPVHADADVQLLSGYTKFRLGQLERGQVAPAELLGNMKNLVNQEFRILDECTKFTEACEEILEACKRADTVEEHLLSDMLEEVMDFCHSLQLAAQCRHKCIGAILEMEKKNLDDFRKLHGYIQVEKHAETALTTVAVGGMGAGVAMVASGPVALVAVALLGLAAGVPLQAHRAAADKVQKSLMEDMTAKNVPIQCMETFAKNLDDAIDRIAVDGGKIGGRSSRIKRRVEMMLEEIQGARTSAAQNILSLAGDASLTTAFGITEQRRSLVAEQCATSAGLALQGLIGGA